MTAAAEPLQLLERLEQLRAFEVARATGRQPWTPKKHQVPPPGDWYFHLLMAGRGAGKSSACAWYYDRWMRQHAGARGGIIAPTIGDGAESCLFGPWGILAHNPSVKVRTRVGGTRILWPNGSEAMLFGAHTRDDIERLRAGGNRGLFWLEELASFRYLKETWENMELALREQPRPHVIGSTTPKPRPYLRSLLEREGTVVTRASTFDNDSLPAAQLERFRAAYAGTRWERQELFGEFADDVEGALWTYETLTGCRVPPENVPDLARVVVAVDPSGGDEDGNDEQGIVVAGRGVDGQLYVLDDRSCKLSPDGWGRRAVQAYVDRRADRLVAEANYGGDMVLSTIRVAAAAMGVEVAAKKITASRGKVARAEPISALYEQGRVHHVGEFPELESQMRNWTPDSGWSPDRLDSCTFALTELEQGHVPRPMRTYVARQRLPTAADRFGVTT